MRLLILRQLSLLWVLSLFSPSSVFAIDKACTDYTAGTAIGQTCNNYFNLSTNRNGTCINDTVCMPNNLSNCNGLCLYDRSWVPTTTPNNASCNASGNVPGTCTCGAPGANGYNGAQCNASPPSPCPNEGEYQQGATCVCPANYELTTIQASPLRRACRPVLPSLDFFKDTSPISNGYPVCGRDINGVPRIPLTLDFGVYDFASSSSISPTNVDGTGTPRSSRRTPSSIAGYSFAFASPSPSSTNDAPIYEYSQLSRCVCTLNKYELVAPAGIGKLQKYKGSGSLSFNPASANARFLPDDYDTIWSQTRNGSVPYSMVAIAKDGVSNGNMGTVFASQGSVCGCPNVNEIAKPTYSGSPATWSGSYCQSLLDFTDTMTANYAVLTTFDPLVHQTTNQISSSGLPNAPQVYSEGTEVFDVSGNNIATNIKLNSANGGLKNYRRRIWTCAPPMDLSANGSALKCALNRTKHACDDGSTTGAQPSSVSDPSNMLVGVSQKQAAFQNTVNKKLACCLNNFNSADATRTQKFDCIDNSAVVASSFNDLWGQKDADEDGGQAYALVLANGEDKLLTGFYTLGGTRCNEFSEFAGRITRTSVNSASVSAQQQTVGNGSASEMVPDSTYVINPPSVITSELAFLKKAIPSNAEQMRRCPLLVRAAIRATCPVPENPVTVLPTALSSYQDTGRIRCPAASQVQILLRIEQIYPIAGQVLAPTIDTSLNSDEAANLDVSELIKNKTLGFCPAGSILQSDGSCTFQ